MIQIPVAQNSCAHETEDSFEDWLLKDWNLSAYAEEHGLCPWMNA
jgi:hypothetical protein